jgi:molybdate transport system ATP-binding protein
MPDRESTPLSVRARVDYSGFSLDVDHRFELSGITGLFGPSGSGKSTLLRLIAGLETGAECAVSFAGETWADSGRGVFVATQHRPVGLVFQDARLFPHLSVDGNLQYALRRKPSSSAAFDLDEVVRIMNVGGLLDRDTRSLSGGERQRVAVARTLLSQPRLLLLDEPLASLDIAHKREVLPYLEALPGRLGIPIIFVSHSVAEMARLADDVVMLEGGEVVAAGPASSILSREDIEVSSWPFEAVSILDVQIEQHLSDLFLTQVRHGNQALLVPAIDSVAPGENVRLTVRAADVVLATSEPRNLSVRNVLRGTVRDIEIVPDSAFATVSLDVGGASLRATLTVHAINELQLEAGKPVYALLKTATFDRSL